MAQNTHGDRAAMTVGDTGSKDIHCTLCAEVSLVSVVLGPSISREGTAQRAGRGLLAGRDQNEASSLEAWTEDRV